MTADPNSIDLSAFMAEHLQRAEPDLLRSMLSTFVQALMSAEADAICGAPYGEPSAATLWWATGTDEPVVPVAPSGGVPGTGASYEQQQR